MTGAIVYMNNYFFLYYLYKHIENDLSIRRCLWETLYVNTWIPPPPLGEGALNGVRKKPGFSGINESGACSKNPPGYRFIISIQGVFRGFLGGFGGIYWLCCRLGNIIDKYYFILHFLFYFILFFFILIIAFHWVIVIAAVGVVWYRANSVVYWLVV